MFTIFDFLKLTGACAGAIGASVLGYREFGWLAVIVVTPLGFIVGAFIGNLPWVAVWAWVRYDFRRSGAAELKQRLEREYYLSHLLIAELVSRGEPVEQFRDYVVGLLRSDNSDEQRFGEASARIWFPDLLPAPDSREPSQGTEL
jgi:hypothetical protein